MASRVAAMALAGARPTAHAPSSPASTEHRVGRTQLSLRSRGRGSRGLIARASHLRPQLPSCSAEEGVMQWLRSAAAALAIAAQISVSLPANAVLYSPDTKIPRTGELALRRAIPANPNMKIIQESLEDISYLLRIPQRKPYGSMEGDVKKAMKIAMDNKEAILGSIPAENKEEGAKLYTSLLEEKEHRKARRSQTTPTTALRRTKKLTQTLGTQEKTLSTSSTRMVGTIEGLRVRSRMPAGVDPMF